MHFCEETELSIEPLWVLQNKESCSWYRVFLCLVKEGSGLALKLWGIFLAVEDNQSSNEGDGGREGDLCGV